MESHLTADYRVTIRFSMLLNDDFFFLHAQSYFSDTCPVCAILNVLKYCVGEGRTACCDVEIHLIGTDTDGGVSSLSSVSSRTSPC